MIFFTQKHPRLIDALLTARENTIAAARTLGWKRRERVSELIALVKRAIVFREQDKVVYEAFTSSEKVAADLGAQRF